MVARVGRWLRTLIRRRTVEREMQEEMALHLESAIERLIARGMSPSDARVAARREFGNVAYFQEEGRRARGSRWIDELAGDLRFALRHFARKPLATGTMVIVLSLGIGVNIALFTVLHSLLTQPAPGIPRDDSVVRIRGWMRGSPAGRRMARSLSYPETQDYAAHRDVFREVAVWTSESAVLATGGTEQGTVSVMGRYVSDNYFRVLGVRPIMGTALPESPSPTKTSTDLAAVISHSIWQRDFGRSRDVLGKIVKVNDVQVTIVGVAPPRFTGVDRSSSGRVIWLTLGARSAFGRSGPMAFTSHDSTFLDAVARLQPGVSARDAMPAVRITAERSVAPSRPLRRTHERSSDVASLASDPDPDRRTEDIVGTATVAALTLLILLVTCTTVSTLLVGAAVARRREIAVRFSLGASRARIVRQLVTESVLLAIASGVLAVTILWVLMAVFRTQVPDIELVPQWETVAFTIVFALGTGVLFGLSPALHGTRLSIADVLKDTAAALAISRSRLQRGLVVIQIALTQPLLVGLGAMIGLFLQGTEPASPLADRILSVNFNMFGGSSSGPEKRESMRRFRERLAAVPGVEGVTLVTSGASQIDYVVHPDDRTSRGRDGAFRASEEQTAPGYFGLLDIPVIRGRNFLPEGVTGDESAVVIRSDLAQELWGAADPIGRRFKLEFHGRPTNEERIVVGVVDARRAGSSVEGTRTRVFVRGVPGSGLLHDGAMVVRTGGPAEAMIPLIRSLAQADLPQIPLTGISTFAANEARARASRIQASAAAAGGGLLALLLSAIGLYAVVAFAVGQRLREIGIRIALGARQGQVVGMFFRTGLRLSAIGLAIGLPISLIGLRLLGASIGMPSSHTPFLMVGIASVVVAVASLATWLPARRGARVDPLVALRAE